MNWQELAEAVLALNEYRRAKPTASLSDIAARAAAIEMHTPGWYLQYWHDRKEYVLVPNIEAPSQDESGFLRVPR